MWPVNYWTGRYWGARYWCKRGGTTGEVVQRRMVDGFDAVGTRGAESMNPGL